MQYFGTDGSRLTVKNRLKAKIKGEIRLTEASLQELRRRQCKWDYIENEIYIHKQMLIWFEEKLKEIDETEEVLEKI